MLKSYPIFILFVPLLIAALTDWHEIDDLHPSSYTYGAASDDYGNFHYVYCSNTQRDYIFHLRREISTGLIRKYGFPLKGECKAADITILNKNIYITYQEVYPCTAKSYACSDNYLAESFDLGETWNPPIIVEPQRQAVNYRYNPLIVVDSITREVRVAYKYLSKENPTYVKVAHKNRGDNYFSAFVRVANTSQSTIMPGGLSFSRSNNDTSRRFHLAWQVKPKESDYLSKIFYSNAGVTGPWKESLVLAETNLADHNSPFILLNDGPNLYLVYVRNDAFSTGVWLSYSSDQGETWAAAKRISAPLSYVSVGGQVCTIGEKKRLYVLAQDQLLISATDALWYIELDTQQIHSLGNPYMKELGDCYNPHIICSGNTIELLCKARVKAQDYKLLYYKQKI